MSLQYEPSSEPLHISDLGDFVLVVSGELERRSIPLSDGKGNSNSHGARPVHLIITMIKWIRTSILSITTLCQIGGGASGFRVYGWRTRKGEACPWYIRKAF